MQLHWVTLCCCHLLSILSALPGSLLCSESSFSHLALPLLLPPNPDVTGGGDAVEEDPGAPHAVLGRLVLRQDTVKHIPGLGRMGGSVLGTARAEEPVSTSLPFSHPSASPRFSSLHSPFPFHTPRLWPAQAMGEAEDRSPVTPQCQGWWPCGTQALRPALG